MHHLTCFRSLVVAELTCLKKKRFMEGLMFLTEQRSGEVKGMLVYNGKPRQEWISRDDKSSPAALTKSILLTAGIDARENRDVTSLEISNAFIRTHKPLDPLGERIAMKVRGALVDWLIELDHVAYLNYVVYKYGKKVLYLEVLRAIYGMLVASLLWYQKRKDLEEIKFVFNNYNPCVANRMINTHQQTIRFCVDDILVLHIDAKFKSYFVR